jgi:hypothetical protein
MLICSVLSSLAVMLARAGTFLAFMAILSLIVMAWVSVCASTKRLHDLGHSGWWNLIALIPIPNVIFGLYLIFARGQDQDNLYGPSLSVVSRDTALSEGTLKAFESSATPAVVVAALDTSAPACVVDMPVASNLDLEPLEKFWDQALQECNDQKMRPGLWARAFADSNGQDAVAKANYLRLRASQLQNQYKLSQDQEKAEKERVRQVALAEQQALETEEAAVLAKMSDAERIETLEPKGRCPNCSAVIKLNSKNCSHCNAIFGDDSAWRIQALSSSELVALRVASKALRHETPTKTSEDSVLPSVLLAVFPILLFFIFIAFK